PLTEDEIRRAAFYRPAEDAPEMAYLRDRRAALGGFLPERRVQCEALAPLPLELFADQLKGSERPQSTTMVVVRMLAKLLGDSELPSLPSLTIKILGRLRDPDVEFDEIAESLSWDPALTVKVLRTVNSAAYAPRQPITEVRQALSHLGRNALEQIVLAVAAKAALPTTSAPGFDSNRFWLTAARRAALGRVLAEKLHPARAGEAFTASLLLDLAVPLMAHGIGERYGETLEEWHATPTADLTELEQRAVGVTHTRVGSWLAESWELPSALVQSIAGHHDAALSDREILPAVRLIASAREVEADRAIDELIELARSEYGLEPDWTQASIEASEAAAIELARQLSGPG
ncbi:MAG: HDOD domain-containing protein, partial [Planctomycetota bacterium]